MYENLQPSFSFGVRGLIIGKKKNFKKSINPKILTLISLKYIYFSVFPDFHKDGMSYRNFSPYHFVGKKISNNFCLELFLVGSIVLEIFAKNLFFLYIYSNNALYSSPFAHAHYSGLKLDAETLPFFVQTACCVKFSKMPFFLDKLTGL